MAFNYRLNRHAMHIELHRHDKRKCYHVCDCNRHCIRQKLNVVIVNAEKTGTTIVSCRKVGKPSLVGKVPPAHKA